MANAQIGPRPRLAATALAGACTVLGAVILSGRLHRAWSLEPILPGIGAMMPNTAIAVVLLGTALLAILAADRTPVLKRVSGGLAIVVAVLVAATLAEYATGVDLRIDRVITPHSEGGVDALHPGRMSPQTAFALLAIAVAVRQLAKGSARYVAGPALIGAALALISTTGHLFGVEALYRIGRQTPMALYTAVSILGLAAAVLCLGPRRGLLAVLSRDDAAGMLTRRLMPLAVLLPMIFGYLRLLGERYGFLGMEQMVALTALACAAGLGVATWWTATRLARIEAARRVAEHAGAAAAARRAEQRFRTLIESAPDAMIVVDRAGVVVLANAQAERLFGYAREEIIGKEMEVLVPQRLRARHVAHRETFARNPHTRAMGAGLELSALRRDGVEIPVEISLAPIESDEGPMVAASVRDATERRAAQRVLKDAHAELERRVEARTAELARANQTLADSEARFRAFMETLPGPAWIKDECFRMVFANHTCAALFGRSVESVLGQTDFDWMPLDVARIARASDEAAMNSGEPVRTQESTPGAGGVTRTWLVTKFRLIEHEGAPPRVAGFALDITELLEAQAALRAVNDELAARNREMEEFVYTASHDLKSPLVSMLGFSGHLQRDAEGGRHDRLVHFAERIDEAARRMRRTIDDLLTLSRAGRVVGQPSLVRLGDVVARILADHAEAITRLGVRVEVAPDLPAVMGDGERLARALDNLVANALKYGCTAPHPRIRVGWSLAGRELRLFVADNGVGIAPEHHERIFRLFQRLDASGDGSGVGLAIVARIAETYGGRTWVESRPGEGATFWISLPDRMIARDPVETSVPDSSTSEPARGAARGEA